MCESFMAALPMCNLCEKVDALLSIEVAVSEERSAGAGETHHRQRHWDWHVHLQNFYIFLASNSAATYHWPSIRQITQSSLLHVVRLPRSVRHLFRCRTFWQLLHCW